MAIFNMVGGGGGSLSATDAILRVIAPAGSTVTISKGGVSKSDQGHENASDTSLYDYYFIIHASQFDSVNPWTVTATLGSDTSSSTIIINSADEYDVVLSYQLWLVKNGVPTGEGGITLTGKQWAKTGFTTVGTVTLSQETDYLQLAYKNTRTDAGSNGYAGICSSEFNAGAYSSIHFDGRFKWQATESNPHNQVAEIMINTATATHPDSGAIAFATLVPTVSGTSWYAVDTDVPIAETSGSFCVFVGLIGLYYNRTDYIQIANMYLE